jgi:DNA-binding winged helix-turn-helix (wHTH) protein/DNA-binding GntR family transcriptional regulator
VLVDRLAASFADHGPGWRLPRRSDLARRFDVTTDEIEAALAELTSRGMIRVLADGQVYRTSPAEYLITLDGLPCLGSRIDPMGTTLTRASRHVLRRDVPEEIARALQLPPGAGTCAIQSSWATDGTITAVSTTYLPASLAAVLLPDGDSADGPGTALNPVPLPRSIVTPAASPVPAASPAALYLEVQPPPQWAARLLRLRPTEPAIAVTVRFDDPAGIPLALTVAVLHAARFRIAVETPDSPLLGGPRGADQVGSGGPRPLDVNGVRLDLEGRRVYADGIEVVLTRKEYNLLRVLVEHAGHALSRRELLDLVWHPGHMDENKTLEVHIRRLRYKLDPESDTPRIRTVRGVGYVFDTAPTPVRRAPGS